MRRKGNRASSMKELTSVSLQKNSIIIDAINNQIMDMNGKIFPLYLLE